MNPSQGETHIIGIDRVRHPWSGPMRVFHGYMRNLRGNLGFRQLKRESLSLEFFFFFFFCVIPG